MLRRVQPLYRCISRGLGAAAVVVLSTLPLPAEGAPVEEAAKFLLILAHSAGSEGRDIPKRA